MNKKLCLIIQARTGSTRLPQKMLLPFYGEQTILDLLLERIKKSISPDIDIIVATSTSEKDLKIVDIAKRNNVLCFKGDESDVLARFIGAAEFAKAESCIRICADNPFLSMKFLNLLITFATSEECDYASFITDKGVPSIKTHYGLWTEYITKDALKRIQAYTNDKIYHEHVTNYAYEHQDEFICKFIPIEPEILNYNFRLTVDTLEDFNNAKNIYKQLIIQNKEIEYNEIIPLISYEMLVRMEHQIRQNSK